MIKRAKMTWTVRDICRYKNKNELTFDNAIQRGNVWDLDKKSLLIHSILVDYPMPEFWMSRENGIYDGLDGKQRYTAMSEFITNQYTIRNVPTVENEDGDIIDVNGKKFENLDQELKDRIMNYTLDIHYFEELSAEQKKEIFYRLNNGKSLTKSEIIKVQAKSLDDIIEIAKHPVFDMVPIKEASKTSFAIDIVMKAYVILFSDSKSLESKKISDEMKKKKFPIEKIQIMLDVFTIMENVCKILEEKDTKDSKTVIKRILTKTHFVTLLPLILYVKENNIPEEKLAEWVFRFFNNSSGATISEEYNKNAMTASARLKSVQIRLDAVKEDFDAFMKL